MSRSKSLQLQARSLHWVLKIGDREKTIQFFRDSLGMQVLRHEEFTEGCKATCNGPYNGKWSKTMVGYGPEDTHFVVELTYNYGIGKYHLGNDFLGITIAGMKPPGEMRSPDGYPFFMTEDHSNGGDPVKKVTVGCKSLATSLGFWSDLLGMEVLSQGSSEATLQFSAGQAQLELKEVGVVDHGTAFGRIAFAVPSSQLPDIEKKVKETGNKILTPLVKLDTPGKATVEVVILADPDEHEICFVGEEAFKTLSQVDPMANKKLDEAMADDKSNEWFAKRGLSKDKA